MCARSLRRATSPVTPWPGTSIPAHVVRGDESPSLEGTGQSVSQPYSVTQSPLSLCVRHGPGVTDAAGPGAMWSPPPSSTSTSRPCQKRFISFDFSFPLETLIPFVIKYTWHKISRVTTFQCAAGCRRYRPVCRSD